MPFSVPSYHKRGEKRKRERIHHRCEQEEGSDFREGKNEKKRVKEADDIYFGDEA